MEFLWALLTIGVLGWFLLNWRIVIVLLIIALIKYFWGQFVWILCGLVALFVLGFLIMCYNELKRYLKRRKAEKQNSENQNLITSTE